MDQIDLRAATVGLVAGVVGCRVVAMLVALSGPRPALVLASAQVVLMVAVGGLVAALQRRRLGLWTRTAALRTTLTAGGAGLVLVLVMEAAAAAAQGDPGVTPVTVLVAAVVWLGGPALGCVLVPPGAARGTAVGVAS